MKAHADTHKFPSIYSLCLTSIFIFCLGVRSPWRIRATTQRSSILQDKHRTRKSEVTTDNSFKKPK